MNIHREVAAFRPVTITLETVEDLNLIVRALVSLKNELSPSTGSNRERAEEMFKRLTQL